jgi:hypothetical protein
MELLPQFEDKEPEDIEKLAQETAHKSLAQQSGARMQAERAAIRSIMDKYVRMDDRD